MKKLLLVDGSSLLHRAFYALPLLSSADGVFTNAVHGFMMMFNRMTAAQRPDLVAVCFDKSRVTFRNAIDPDYKGMRAETPVELRGQFELIKQVLDLSGVKWLEIENYEADDLLGTLARQGGEAGYVSEIFSGDRDVFQLIDDRTTVYMTKKGISEIERYDRAAIRARYGVEPAQLIDIKALMGDQSDNITGVPGVGEKTAVKLIGEFGSLDTLYASLEQVSGDKLREKLRGNRELAYRSRVLATICLDAPLAIDWAQYAFHPGGDKSRLAALYQKLGLQQLLRGLNKGEAAAPPASLFGVSAEDAEEKPWPTAEETATPVRLEQPLPDRVMGLLPQADAIRIAYGGEERQLMADQLPEQRALLEDAAVAKTACDAKPAIEWLARQGVTLRGLTDDVLIAAYLLDPAAGSYDEMLLSLAETPALTAAALPRLAGVLRGRLDETGMLKLYEEMELPLVTVLAEMELNGIRVREEKLASMSDEFAAAIDEYQRRIYELAGHEFNLNSPKQLGVVLFEEMGIPPLKKTKTGYSTDAEVLETLALSQPIARLLLDYRLASKLRSTYTDGLRKLIDPVDGKLHTSFKQTVTATGRLSSVEPNLQNIPVRHELGRRIREVFTADQPGDLLLAADYNQIELRILAHMSGDDKLIQAYLNGEDIHTRTAAEVLGVDPAEITPLQRRRAKAVNFGIIYGISDYGLSRDLGISRQEAEEYIRLYFSRYPKVEEYQRRTIAAARQAGYAETLYGRRRYLPDLNNRNFNLRSFAERMAINAPVQGSAADIIKLAMIAVSREIKSRGLAMRMLLQVHDELIFNLPASELATGAQLVKSCMEGAAQLAVPLTVDVKQGPDWYHMEKFTF